jgi:glycosyltransferase involved in cell wall biosynthesis
MRIVFTSYVNTCQFTKPEDWIRRIRGYTGILECLSKTMEVISIEQINYEGRFDLNGVRYEFLNFGKDKQVFPFKLHQYIKGLKPDVVFVHGMHFPLQVILLRMKLGKKVKVIVQNHAEKPWNGWRRWLQRQASGSIDAYLFTSLAMSEAWKRKKIIRQDSKVHEVMEASSVFSPMDKSVTRNKTSASGNPIFLWVGRLDSNKDPLTVVRSFLHFSLHRPEARLFMIYHTDELLNQLEKEIAIHRNGPGAVQFIGKVEHEEMQYWFNSAEFIISGSHYEGSGVAVCEAMSCGCVPILTKIDAFKKLTANGHCGFLYEAGNQEELLSILLNTNKLNMEYEKQKVLNQFDSSLSFTAIAGKIEEIAISLINK